MTFSPLICMALLASAVPASATVTLFFNPSPTQATNFADASGAGGSKMAWGVIIDTARDGFGFDGPGGYSQGFTLTPGDGQSLTDANGVPDDDYLFVCATVMALMTNTNDGAEIGMNRITAITSLVLAGGVGTDDPFAIVWFDQATLGTPTQPYGKFGILSDASFLIPFDGETRSYTAPFEGPDPLKPMNYTLAPEPSGALLGLLGIAGLLRRRR